MILHKSKARLMRHSRCGIENLCQGAAGRFAFNTKYLSNVDVTGFVFWGVFHALALVFVRARGDLRPGRLQW